MISSREEYFEYLREDKIALERDRNRPGTLDYVWRFQRLLRRAEYLKNCKSGFFSSVLRKITIWRLQRLKALLGFSIPLNVFGPGLSIAHYGTIVVNRGARIGSHCRLHACVNIGTQAGHQYKAPQIGDYVYIGPGAKIYGEIQIADNIAIRANAVVNKSFTTPGVTIAGVPARMISNRGTEDLINRGDPAE